MDELHEILSLCSSPLRTYYHSERTKYWRKKWIFRMQSF